MKYHIFHNSRLLQMAVILAVSCIFTAYPGFASEAQTLVYTRAHEGFDVNGTDGIKETAYIPSSAKVPTRTAIIVSVSWEDDNDRDRIRPESVDLYLIRNGISASKKTVTEKENWACAFTALPLYDKNGDEIMYCVAENSLPGYSISQNRSVTEQPDSIYHAGNTVYSFMNRREPSRTDLTVRAFWNDSMNHEKIRPLQTKVQLYADGRPCGKDVTLNKKNHWCCRFKGLPVNNRGKRITYTVAQEYVPEEYQESLSVSEDGDFLIENRHDPAESVSDDSSDMTQISGCVRWEDADDQDRLRPDEIEVFLYADGKLIARKNVSSSDGWLFSFDSLPKYTDGTEISYSAGTSPINGYQTFENSCSLTCIHDPETITLQGKIEWAGEDESASLRPHTVSLTLLSDQESLKTIKVQDTDGWSFSIPSLPKHTAGKEIPYCLEPDSCAGYQACAEGMTVTYTQIAPAAIPDPGPRAETFPKPERLSDQPANPASFLPLFPVFFLFLAASPAFMFRKKNRRRTGRRN